jgi:CheY-like chemotaxis protein
MRADVAADGREGVEMMHLHPYDVVFLDCQMPVMNGFEAAAAIRALPCPNRSVRIVAMTADTRQETHERCLAAGMDDFIAKPVRWDDFLRVMEPWIPDSARSRISSGAVTEIR